MSIDITAPGANASALKLALRKLADPYFIPPAANIFTVKKATGSADPTFTDTDEGLVMDFGENRLGTAGKVKMGAVAVNSAADWTLKSRIRPRLNNGLTGNFGVGIGILNNANSKLIEAGALNIWNFGAWVVNGTLDAYSADVATNSGTINRHTIGIRIRYVQATGTIFFDYSVDGNGESWIPYASQAQATYLGAAPTHVGPIMHCGSVQAAGVTANDKLIIDRWELA
jgi:hypothetical protein